jgi:hypothetical protein
MRNTLFIIFFFFCGVYIHPSHAQKKIGKDSLQINTSKADKDSMRDALGFIGQKKDSTSSIQKLVEKHPFLNTSSTALSLPQHVKKTSDQSVIFYIIMFLFLVLGVLRIAYTQYVENIFRVFFNTSLRQSQLTDQLLQAKLQSLLFNMLFILSFSFFIFVQFGLRGWLALDQWGWLGMILIICATVYIVKFLMIQLMSWVTGIRQVLDAYLFTVFMINKLLVFVFLPAILLMLFTTGAVQKMSMNVSLILLGLFFLYRYLRSYQVILPSVRLSKFHFFLFVICLELIPLLLLARLGVMFVSKSL